MVPKQIDDYLSNTTLFFKLTIRRDLLLLENQLPMFVLEELYHSVVVTDGTLPIKLTDRGYPSFLDLASNFFSPLVPSQEETKQEEAGLKLKHLTDLVRYLYHPSGYHCASKESTTRESKEAERGSNKPYLTKCFTYMIRYFYRPSENGETQSKSIEPCSVVKSATKLKEAWVKFKPVSDIALLDIQFKSYFCYPFTLLYPPHFELPKLFLNEVSTNCALRNLIAFEQCHDKNNQYICNYVGLLSDLMEAKEDVEFLVEKGLLDHTLGSNEEVANLLKSLGRQVVVSSDIYDQLSKDVNEYYESLWTKLRLVYFRDLWRTSSTVVGLVVFVFSTTNTIRSFLHGF